MSFTLIFAGVILGFVLSSVLFIQKLWNAQDRANEWRARARFYKKEYLEAARNSAEWSKACDTSDLFKKF